MNWIKKALDYRHVYVGTSSAKIGFRKIGIANNPRQRWKDIDRSTGRRSKERRLFSFPMLWAGLVEKILHWMFYPWRKRHRGSGRTEWFHFSLLAPFVDLFLFVLLLALSLASLGIILAAIATATLTAIALFR